jgi:alkylated DNA repair dioxygenase AlkB
MSQQPSFFTDPAPMPDGFRYQSDLISPAEEADLAAWIATMPLKPYEFRGHLGNRRIAAFGLRYDHAKASMEQAEDVAGLGIPPILLGLRHRIADFAKRKPEDFIQAMATEYAPGAGIGWHKDRPQFGEIVGVSLFAEARLRLRRKDGQGWQRLSQVLQPRSAYLLSGAVRRSWEHSIPPQERLRYSITFRTGQATDRIEPR